MSPISSGEANGLPVNRKRKSQTARHPIAGRERGGRSTSTCPSFFRPLIRRGLAALPSRYRVVESPPSIVRCPLRYITSQSNSRKLDWECQKGINQLKALIAKHYERFLATKVGKEQAASESVGICLVHIDRRVQTQVPGWFG